MARSSVLVGRRELSAQISRVSARNFLDTSVKRGSVAVATVAEAAKVQMLPKQEEQIAALHCMPKPTTNEICFRKTMCVLFQFALIVWAFGAFNVELCRSSQARPSSLCCAVCHESCFHQRQPTWVVGDVPLTQAAIQSSGACATRRSIRGARGSTGATLGERPAAVGGWEACKVPVPLALASKGSARAMSRASAQPLVAAGRRQRQRCHAATQSCWAVLVTHAHGCLGFEACPMHGCCCSSYALHRARQ